MKSIPKLCLFALVWSSAWSSAAFAQATLGAGAAAGLVHDTYGDGMPDTVIDVVNDQLGVHQSVTTTDDGIFRAAGLPPAPGYKLTASHNGFVDYNSEFFTIPAGETVNFIIGLKEDSKARHATGKSGSIKVGGDIDDHQLSIDTSILGYQLDWLPLKPRTLDPLILQATAVTNNTASGTVSILGQTVSNETYTDGIQTSSTYYTQQTPVNNAVPLDAIGGLQVMAADAPGEFKDGMSGIVNSSTRIGTDSYHGTAYGFLRMPGLTAVGRFALGQKLLHGENQAGGSFTGPILSDKLFFFANLENMNDRYDAWNRITSPLISDPTGSFVVASNCKASATACANADKFIQSQMNVLVPLSQHSLNGLAKLDYQFAGNSRINLEFGTANAIQPNGQQVEDAISNGGLLGIRTTRVDSHFLQAGWVINPSSGSVNELRAAVAENHLYTPYTQSSLSTGNVAISLYGDNIGNSTTGSNLFTEQRYQVFDNFTFSGGPNTFEFGVDWTRTHYYINQLAFDGDYNYESLTNFATDFGTTTGRSYTYYTQSFGDPARDLSYKQLGVYGGDTLRLNPRLTLNFGIRWEKPGNPQPKAIDENLNYYQTGSIASPNLDLMPRVGLAYRWRDKTTFHAGMGFFFTPFYGQLLDALYLGNAIYQTSIEIVPTQTNAPQFPKAIGTNIPGDTAEVMYSTSKLRNPHTQQVNIGVERELPFNATINASYINSRGDKLWTVGDDNLAPATKTGTFTIDDASGAKTGTFQLPVFTVKNDPTISHAYDLGNGGSSWYDALAVELRKKMSHGVTVQADYTWSHAIDIVNGPLIQGGVPFIVPLTYNSSNRDSSTTDQRQRLTVNATWNPKATASTSMVARYLLNGWQLSAIGVMASGLPETPEVLSTGQQLSGITPLFANTLDGSGSWDRVPFLPVAYYRTGAQYNWNARFTRTLPFTERIRGSLMFEVFNILNSQWITGVNTADYTATAGILHPVAGAGTPNQAGSYPYQTNARSAQVAFRVTF